MRKKIKEENILNEKNVLGLLSAARTFIQAEKTAKMP